MIFVFEKKLSLKNGGIFQLKNMEASYSFNTVYQIKRRSIIVLFYAIINKKSFFYLFINPVSSQLQTLHQFTWMERCKKRFESYFFNENHEIAQYYFYRNFVSTYCRIKRGWKMG